MLSEKTLNDQAVISKTSVKNKESAICFVATYEKREGMHASTAWKNICNGSVVNGTQ